MAFGSEYGYSIFVFSILDYGKQKQIKKSNFHSSEFLLTHLFMNESKVIITGVAHVIKKFIFGVFGWRI